MCKSHYHTLILISNNTPFSKRNLWWKFQLRSYIFVLNIDIFLSLLHKIFGLIFCQFSYLKVLIFGNVRFLLNWTLASVMMLQWDLIPLPFHEIYDIIYFCSYTWEIGTNLAECLLIIVWQYVLLFSVWSRIINFQNLPGIWSKLFPFLIFLTLFL